MAGLNPTEIATLVALIGDIHLAAACRSSSSSTTCARSWRSRTDRRAQFRETVAEGPPAAIANHPPVIEAYLGEDMSTLLPPR